MKRGDIRWYKFLPPDKRQPVLILTRDSVLQYLREVTVAPITPADSRAAAAEFALPQPPSRYRLGTSRNLEGGTE